MVDAGFDEKTFFGVDEPLQDYSGVVAGDFRVGVRGAFGDDVPKEPMPIEKIVQPPNFGYGAALANGMGE